MYQHNLDIYQKRVAAFGWHTIVVDGHDVHAIVNALDEAAHVKGKPTCILAKTFKGKFFPEIEDNATWHGKPLGNKTEAVINSVKALIKDTSNKLGYELLPIKAPTNQLTEKDLSNVKLSKSPSYKLGEEVLN